MPSKNLDFRHHPRNLGDNRYVYAVVSRRAQGLSIGINMNPDKVCNFDCPYCQVDRRIPGGDARIDLPLLEVELAHLLQSAQGDLWSQPPFDTVAPALRRVADLAFAGDGEPTSPPEFAQAAQLAQTLKNTYAPHIPLRLLTNATLLHRERVQEGLVFFDELWCKLDAGTEPYFQIVDGTRLPFNRILKNLKAISKQRPIFLQCMFMTIDNQPPPNEEITAWSQRIAEILEEGGSISGIQVYTVARSPASPRVGPLSEPALEHIAAIARPLGLPVTVHR